MTEPTRSTAGRVPRSRGGRPGGGGSRRSAAASGAPPAAPAKVLELVTERPAPAGDVVAHADDGRVVFIRHALPGERVRVTISEQNSRFLRGEVLEVLEPAPDRVAAPCPHARPGGCGGCDLQHVAPEAQRRWKADVVRDQLRRLGGIEGPLVDALVVEAVPDVAGAPGPGLGWRTRVQWAVSGAGRPGLHRHRSHEVEPLEACPLAHALVDSAGVLGTRQRDRRRVEVVSSPSSGQVLVGPCPSTSLTYSADDHEFRVSGGGFWQVHPAAADTLVAAVLEALAPAEGEQAFDLYAGAGLFAVALARRGVSVLAVESSQLAARDARYNLDGLPADVIHGEVAVVLAGGNDVIDGLPDHADLVVLDPPRSGAGRDVMRAIAERHPRAVAYVSCDAATLARDLAAAREAGVALKGLRAFDLFPMTAHLELVAVLG